MNHPAHSGARHFFIFFAGLALLVLGAAGYWFYRVRSIPTLARPGSQPDHENEHESLPLHYQGVQPTPETLTQVPTLGRVRVSEDTPAKQGDFWLEQMLYLPPALKAGPIADLYVALDPQTGQGTRLRLTDTELKLEKLSPNPELLGQADVTQLLLESVAKDGPHILGALWRNGELTAWINGTPVLVWKGAADLKAASGAAGASGGVTLGPRRAMPLSAISFRDGFMRASAGHFWKPACGKWELTALAFPERSANPFSLRASFSGEAPTADRLYKDRLRREHYGIGVQLSMAEGTLHIVRITGGSPAARAGLAENDTVVEVDGASVEGNEWQAQNLLLGSGGGRALQLKILRAGEKRLLDFTIPREMFKWGTPLEGKLIQPVSDSHEALILGGEHGWSDYAAEVCIKPLGTGGAGLAIAVTSPGDALLLRWNGPPHLTLGRKTASDVGQPTQALKDPLDGEKLQLVRLEKGQEHILAETPLRYRPYEFYRLTLDWQGEHVTAFLDGVEVFRKKVPGLRRGQVGLYALRGEPVFFDDVAVASNRAELESARKPERTINEVFAAEQDMEGWANPALEWDRDLKTGWAVHKGRFPGEHVVVLHEPKFEELEIKPLLSVDAQTPWSFPSLLIRGGKASFCWWNEDGTVKRRSQEVEVGRGALARVVLRASTAGASAEIGPIRMTTQELGFAPSAERVDPLPRTRIAIRGLRNLGDPRTVRVSSSGVLEYTFDGAPADWKVASGRWGLLNKWICDPRWSWFGGRSETTAAIWNKKVFGGAVTVEAHIALMMQKDDPPYERAGDYNLILCGDGTHLDSGYALIFGGGRNYWTRLYRNGKQVAESTDPRALLPSDRVRQPDKPELHQRWFHLKLEKIGNQVSFYRDDFKAFTYTDPEPLTEGRVGFWTVNNGVLLSRCRIAFDTVKPGPLESRDSALFDDGTVINMFDGEVLTRVEPEQLPPAIAGALAASPTSFRPATAEPLLIEPRAETAQGWRVTNGVGGGPLVLHWKNLLVDPGDISMVRFAARIEPGAAVDFVLRDLHNSHLFRWRISGPKECDENLPCIGEINIPADGKWHAVEVDLWPTWQAYWRSRGHDRPPRMTLYPLFGCPSCNAYAVAGYGVNRKGATFAVSPISFLRVLDTDRTVPKLAQVVWPYDALGDGQSLQLQFDDAGGSGIHADTLAISLGGRSVDLDSVRFDPITQTAVIDLWRFFGGQPLTEGQAVPLAISRWADRAGNAGQPHTSSWTYRIADARKAASAAAPPRIEVLSDVQEEGSTAPAPGALQPGDVLATGGGRECVLNFMRTGPPWATEQRSVRMTSLRDGAHLGLQLTRGTFDLARWPYLALEYKIPFETPLNLHFSDANNARHTLLLTDLGEHESGTRRFGHPGMFRQWEQSNAVLGPPEGFVADGTWRRTEIPLHRLLAAEKGKEVQTRINSLDLRDGGYRGNRRGMEYFIHAFHALPASRSRGIAFRWTSQDLLGNSDYAAVIDEKPDTEPVTGRKDIRPNETVEGGARRVLVEAGLPVPDTGYLISDGWKYLHLRLKNVAGQWSRTVHYPFRIDNSPPKVVKTEPAHGGTLAGKTLRIHFADDHVIKPGSIRLAINNVFFSEGQPGVSFDYATNVLTYDDTLSARPRDWTDGAAVKVEVQGVADTLGNELFEHYAFGFTIDRKQDTQGPAITKVRFAAASQGMGEDLERPMQLEMSMALNFEETLGHVRALQDCVLDWTKDAATVAFGERAVRFTAQENNGHALIMLHKNAWHMDRYPLLMFDYKADPGFNVDLEVLVLGVWHSIRFLGAGEGALGAVPGVQANGTWRHAAVDVRRLIDHAVRGLPVRIVSQARLSSRGAEGLQRGATLWLDNLQFSTESGSGGQLEWAAEPDASGIEGYSVSVTKNPEDEAPKFISNRETWRGEPGRTGTWYAHIRACDQAGNWGPTRHYRLDF